MKKTRSDKGKIRQPVLNDFRTTKWHKMPDGKRKDRRGRPRFELRMPPYLFEQIKEEALKREISFNRLCIELLEVGIAP